MLAYQEALGGEESGSDNVQSPPPAETADPPAETNIEIMTTAEWGHVFSPVFSPESHQKIIKTL